MKEQIGEQLESEGYMDLLMSGVLPSCLDMTDVESLLQQEDLLKHSHLQDSFLFKKDFLARCLSSLKKEIT